MRKTLPLGLLSLALALAACGRNDAPAAPGQASVTAQAAFPSPAGPVPFEPPFPWPRPAGRAAVTGQGVPSGTASAELRVYDGAAEVAAATLTPAEPSAALRLAKGKTYRFTLSARDPGGRETAWAETAAQVDGDTSVALSPAAVLGGAFLSPPAYPAQLRAGGAAVLTLRVHTPGSYTVGPDDYSVSYALGELDCAQGPCAFVENGQLGAVEAAGKQGVKVRAAAASAGKVLAVRALVQGLGADHRPAALEALYGFVVLGDLPADDGLALVGTVADWPGASAEVQVQAASSANGPALGQRGAVAPDGALSVALPAGSGVAGWLTSFDLGQDPPYCTGRWEARPAPFNYFTAYFGVLQGGAWKGELAVNGGGAPGAPGYRQAVYMYFDRDVTAKGSQTCDPGYGSPLTYSYDFAARKGWNLMVVEFTADGGVMRGGPAAPALPEGLAWRYSGEALGGGGDAAVDVGLDLAAPSVYAYLPAAPGAGGPLAVAGSAFDDRAVREVELFVDFEPLPVSVTGGALGSGHVEFAAEWTPPAPGRYLLTAVVRDAAGNSSSDQAWVTVP